MSHKPKWEKDRAVLYAGDCVEVMQAMEAESVDAVVCDPPYGLEFMGKEWDAFKAKDRNTGAKNPGQTRTWCDKESSGIGVGGPRFSTQKASDMRAFQQWSEQWCREAYRVLKPGGHLLAFGGTRTYHRLACAVEDAGFEVRDCLSWLYGSGFPKSLDVSKAIDKKRDDYEAVRSVVGFLRQRAEAAKMSASDINAALGWGTAVANHFLAPSRSNAACPTWEQWEELRTLLGFGDAMDAEVWRLNGRKGQPGEAWYRREVTGSSPWSNSADHFVPGGDHTKRVQLDITAPATDAAREWEGWGTALKPAWEPVVVARKPLIGTVAENVQAHGTGALNIDACRIGSEGGTKATGIDLTYRKGDPQQGFRRNTEITEIGKGRWPANVAFDEEAAAMLGEPSRFFYCAKASRSERNAGTDKNAHPTVKPVAVMRWLIRLVTPPGGTVLDPFAGSGTTGCAAICEDTVGRIILIEREADYQDIITSRVGYAIEEKAAGRDPFPVEKTKAKRTQSASRAPAKRKQPKKRGMTAVELGEQLGLDKAA